MDDGVAWGYIQDTGYKSPISVIHYLFENVSKNGHLLLNIGPKKDGAFPAEAKEILREMGKRLALNCEAIYGATTWVNWGEGPHQVTKNGAFNENNVPVFDASDVRFTVKDQVLYAICLGIPKGQVTIESLKQLWAPEICSVRMLGVDQDLEWTLNGRGLTIIPPLQKAGDHAVVFKIERGKGSTGAIVMGQPLNETVIFSHEKLFWRHPDDVVCYWIPAFAFSTAPHSFSRRPTSARFSGVSLARASTFRLGRSTIGSSSPHSIRFAIIPSVDRPRWYGL